MPVTPRRFLISDYCDLPLQLVIKRKVEEFRKQREEEDRQRQLEDIFIAEAEKEERRLLAQQEIVRFQERVKTSFAFMLTGFDF